MFVFPCFCVYNYVLGSHHMGSLRSCSNYICAQTKKKKIILVLVDKNKNKNSKSIKNRRKKLVDQKKKKKKTKKQISMLLYILQGIIIKIIKIAITPVMLI